MKNLEATILAQFANSPVLLQLINNVNGYIDPAANLALFYVQIFNLDTATGYGLDVWGRILGVGRVLNVASGQFLGFDEATTASAFPFNQAPFYTGQATTSNYALSDSAYRVLLFAKALANITNCSIPALNQILLNLFPGRGNCFVTDGLNETMTYTFDFILQPFEAAIVQQSGVLPKPAGVTATVVQI